MKLKEGRYYRGLGMWKDTYIYVIKIKKEIMFVKIPKWRRTRSDAVCPFHHNKGCGFKSLANEYKCYEQGTDYSCVPVSDSWKLTNKLKGMMEIGT